MLPKLLGIVPVYLGKFSMITKPSKNDNPLTSEITIMKLLQNNFRQYCEIVSGDIQYTIDN